MASNIDWRLYPDIHKAGGLGPALTTEFARLGTTLDVDDLDGDGEARVEGGRRVSQLRLVPTERLITFHCWDEVELGQGRGPDLTPIAETVAAWLTQGLSVSDMETRFPLFQINVGAREFESGGIVEHAWAILVDSAARDSPRQRPLIEAAKLRPELRQLRPFTSHHSLCFSRGTGCPYTNDVAHAIPLENGQYRALGPGYVLQDRTYHNHHYREAEYDILGEGDAEHVIALIVAALPPDCGPAVTGTAADVSPI